MTSKRNSLAIEDGAPTTVRLLRMLETSPRRFQEQQLSKKNDPSFHGYLNKLMADYECHASTLVVGACISKTYVYQFINGERLPGRDIILRISLAMGLTLDETQRLLTLAGKSILYPRIRRDAGILYCIRKKMSLDEANSFLEDISEVPML